MEAPKPALCSKCDHPLTDSGTCSNKKCISNHPTWRPNASGKCATTTSGAMRLQADLRCHACQQAISEEDESCPYCAAKTGPSSHYHRVISGNGIPQQRVPQFESLPLPTGSAPTLTRKSPRTSAVRIPFPKGKKRPPEPVAEKTADDGEDAPPTIPAPSLPCTRYSIIEGRTRDKPREPNDT